MDKALRNALRWISLLLGVALLATTLPQIAVAQDEDDPPGRVARLGYMQGSVSFQPGGEPDWVQAVPNRPMTIDDKLWADRDSRAEVELGSAVVRLAPYTGFSFLNLDDRTVQIQLTSGAINFTVRRLDRDDVFEVDTPNLAFSVFRPGRYRVEASEDGNYTVVSIRDGEGEATGNGQTYTLHAGQRGTFSGTQGLNAEVIEIGRPDQFDNWAYSRDRRYEQSRSARYLSRDVVGYEDLDDYGEWRDDSNYGHIWFPVQVAAGWAPYREGHWVWISPWGWTWVDDAPWGYAPFHYGRWVAVGGRWGWIPGPVDVRPVYAPALVVFLGAGGGFGGNVGWFPLGPREVYVPSYRVSRVYLNRVNVSNTTISTTTITNVYNTTVVNRTTTITNVNYVNRNVAGAVTAVPQRAFVSAQPVAKVAVAVNVRETASVPVSPRAAVAPARESVLGPRASTAGHVAAPPPAVVNRPVIAKATPPPPPVPFAKQQQALAAHPGEPLARHEVQTLRPTNTPAGQPTVKQAPPGKPATPNVSRAGNPPGNPPSTAPNAGRPPAAQPGNQPEPNRPSAAQPGNRPEPNQPPAAQPGNRPEPNRPPAAQPSNRPEPNRPPSAQPENRPEPNRPPSAQPGNRPEPNRPPTAQPENRPEPNRPPAAQPSNRPEPNRPPSAQPENRPEPNRPPSAQPGNRPEPNRPPTAQPENRPEPNRPPSAQPGNRPESNRPSTAQPGNRPEPNRPPAAQPENRPQPNRPPAAEPGNRPEPNRPPAAEQQRRQKPEAQKPEDKKRQDEQRKPEEKPPQ